jgi:signal transduction histidine kinase/ActR/RegA family two-component response regulator
MPISFGISPTVPSFANNSATHLSLFFGASLRCFVFHLAVLLFAVSNSASLFAAEAVVENRILMIYGSTDVGEWEQAYNSAILRELAVGTSTELIPEFLNLTSSSTSEQELMARSLLLQYGDSPIDLVISVSPEAGTFARQWSELFAREAPRLYVLPGSDILDDIANLSSADYLLRSAVNIAAERTLQLIPQAIPNLTDIYVVGGYSDGDLSYAERIADAAERSGIEIEPTFVLGLLPDELLTELRSIPDTSAVLVSTYDNDRLGQPQRTAYINSLLDGNISVPVFALFDSQLGRGPVGGNMSSSTNYAEGTAHIARNILTGASIEQITDAPTQYMFDAERLSAFNIDRNLLPAESIFVNDIPSFVEENLHWLIAISTVIVAQLVLIALLWRANYHRRRTEEALKTTQKMEALGSLAGGIAHDFNNILMAIMANAELARSSLDEPERASSRLANIISASNRAKGLISQILLFSRQAATQSFETVDVGAMLSESVEQIVAFLPPDCSLELHCEDNLPPLSVDSNQLHQAVMNICINAQHAMNNKGKIEITARFEAITDEKKIFTEDIPPGNYIAIEIKDNGIGIDEENQRHIFEPFFTTKPQGKGTGLGLALVYRVVRAHEGYIDLHSHPGDGTVFTIYLKAAAQPTPKSARALSSSALKGHGERILLVDDDDMVLDATARMLERLNYKVHSFRSSLKALAAFKEAPQKWDLVFTDLSMPEMDGARLGAQIRQVRSDISIILYTGYLDAVDAIELENLRILSKPSRLEDIANAVATALAEPHTSH